LPITGYRVYRGAAGATPTLYATVAPNAIGMTDTVVTKKATYTYLVTAFNVRGESVTSNLATATAR
jgi:hypothetical protein